MRILLRSEGKEALNLTEQVSGASCLLVEHSCTCTHTVYVCRGGGGGGGGGGWGGVWMLFGSQMLMASSHQQEWKVIKAVASCLPPSPSHTPLRARLNHNLLCKREEEKEHKQVYLKTGTQGEGSVNSYSVKYFCFSWK